MVAVKIICGCGQKYSFIVYPVNGRMPAPIQCPVCGMDGTAAANDVIQGAMVVQPPVQPAVKPTVQPISAGALAADAWRQRAMEAERRAEQAQAAARNGITPQIAQAIKEALVQELAAQRNELLQAQQMAAAELAQLTRQLDELQVPMQERLRSYETRIEELQKELSARNEENRELLKMKIDMMRRQIDVERGRTRMEFN